MNQPDRYARFLLPEGAHKVTYDRDSRLTHSGTFVFMQEDHTMGNLLRMQLHLDKQVVFAGYRIPHPLENKMVVRVQTTGVKTPVQALEHALDDLRSELTKMRTDFATQFQLALRDQPGGGQAV